MRSAMTDAAFRSVLKSQYHAALAMLREAVERCPADEWSNAHHKNAFWQYGAVAGRHPLYRWMNRRLREHALNDFADAQGTACYDETWVGPEISRHLFPAV